MNEVRIDKLIKLFVAFAWRIHKVRLYPYQLEIATKVLRAVLAETGEDIFAQISRQSGKTEVVVLLVEFLMIFFPKLFNRPFRVGIFAPQNEQTKTDFDRLKTNLEESWREGFQVVVDPKESNAVTLQLPNKSFCYTFPLTETSHPESKTLDFVIYEEANKIKDKEKKDKADPMRSATNGASLSCGVGGYHSNYFKRGIDIGENVIKADYKLVMDQKKKEYEKDGNTFHLNYPRFVEKMIKDVGADDESFRTQYGLEFIVGGGSFITAEQLHALRGDHEIYISTENECVAGLDTAKFPDRTVLTVKDLKEKRIACWLELQGDNYEDQFHIIKKRLEPVWKEKDGKRQLVSGFPNLITMAIDSTGQGDFMPDLFENNSDIDILRIKFSMQSKDAMSKNLMVQIRNKATTYPRTECRERKRFELEMMELEREYKGEYLSVHHPDDPKAHDDYFASWLLCEWAHHEFLANMPEIHVIETKREKSKRDDAYGDPETDDDNDDEM